jgi:hypothetical protein
VSDIDKKAIAVQDMIEARKLRAGVDYRPHSNLERVNSQIRNSAERTAEITLAGLRVTACDNRWGDGIFSVTRSVDAEGRVVRVQVELGTAKRQTLMRSVMLRSKMAIVTMPVASGSEIRFAERFKPANPQDSGWFLSTGTETQAQMDSKGFLQMIWLGKLLERQPKLEAILDAPVGRCSSAVVTSSSRTTKSVRGSARLLRVTTGFALRAAVP